MDLPVPSIMPFADPAVEQDFLAAFHETRSRWDVLVALVFLCSSMNLSAVPQLARTAFLFGVAQALALLITSLPGYTKWRCWAIYALRMSTAIGMYFANHALLALPKEPTFLQAAWTTGFSYSRFKFGMFIGLFYPVPLRGFGITFQTLLLAFLLQLSEKECRSIQNGLPNYQVFVSQLEQLYILWEHGGGQPACAHMCGDVLSHAVNQKICSATCRYLLPFTFSVYGRPWMAACVMHRCIAVAFGGYILPLMGLYIWEMRDRWIFARARGMPTVALNDTILLGVPPILMEIGMNLLLVLTQILELLIPSH